MAKTRSRRLGPREVVRIAAELRALEHRARAVNEAELAHFIGVAEQMAEQLCEGRAGSPPELDVAEALVEIRAGASLN